MDEESRKYAFDSGRGAGHAEAIVAAYDVLSEIDKYEGNDYHVRHMAIMDVIKAIQRVQS